MHAEETAGAVHEEEENYFVSMTDMMIGVLFIFIIMLMVFALDYRGKADDQTKALEVARQVAARLDDMQSKVHDEIDALNRSQEARRKLLFELKDELAKENLQVEIDESNGVLRLTEAAVRFDADKAALSDQARENVGRIASALGRVLPQYAACRISGGEVLCDGKRASSIETVFIEGHTDVTGVKDVDERDRRNWQLSTERAVATYVQLIRKTPELRGLRNSGRQELVSVSAYSSTRPIDPAEASGAYAKNRRIDLRFVMEVNSRRKLQEILELTEQMKGEIVELSKASGR